MARSDWQYLSGSTNNNSAFFTGIRWRYRDDLFGTAGYPTDRVATNKDIIEYQPYIGRKQTYTSFSYTNWKTSYYKYSYNTTSGSDPATAGNQLNISTTFRFDKASNNTKYYPVTGNLSAGNVFNTSATSLSRIIEVEHCSDGTSKVRLFFHFTGDSNTNFSYAETNAIITLDTIPRATPISVPDADIGSSTTISVVRASNDFKTKIEYVAPGMVGYETIVDNWQSDNYGWTVPTSIYALIPDNKYITATFKATTKDASGNSIGITYDSAILTAKGDPEYETFTLQDVNSTTTDLTSDNTKMVRYASNVKVTVKAKAKNSAYIKTIKVNGSEIYSAPAQNPPATVTVNTTINSASSNVFGLEIIDSRQYRITPSQAMTMVSYIPLTISATATRNQPTDGKVNLNVSGNYWGGNFGNQNNTLTVQYRYKESTSSTWGNWTNMTVTTNNNNNTYSGTLQLSNMNYTKQYNFEFKATDKIYTGDGKQAKNITVTKGTPIFWWNNNGFNVNGNLSVSSAINVVNGVNFNNGHDKYIYWKENGYGDKFGISPDFNGTDNSNHLRIRGAVGGAGTDPSMYDLAWISGKDGNAWLKGRLDVDGDLRTRRKFIFALDAQGGASGKYYKLANIPATSDANSIQVNIKGDIGAWVRKKGTIDLQVCNREEFKVYGTLYGNPNCYESQTIVIYKESNNSHTIYLRCIESYIGPNTLEITWGGGAGLYPTIYTDYPITTSPSGTLVWTSSHSTITPLCSMEGTNVVTRTGGATLTSSTWRRFGNVVQLTIVINTTSSTNTGSNAFTGTINNSALIPKIPINSSSYNGSTSLNCYIDASGNITCRVLASNLSSGKEMTIGFTYVI